MSNLGVCYHDGTGVVVDDVEAVRWYRLSAEAGNELGQYNLGECYELGFGVAADALEATRWYRMAAEAGDTDAQKKLGQFNITPVTGGP